MGRSLNKWMGIGNVTKDPDTRYMPSGSAVTNISIACNDSYKDKTTGNPVEQTEYINLVFFGKLAEIVNEHVKKGSKIYVEGKFTTDKYQDKETGQDRYSSKIKVNEMLMLDSKPKEGQASQRPPVTAQNQQMHQGANNANGASGVDDFDEDLIPF